MRKMGLPFFPGLNFHELLPVHHDPAQTHPRMRCAPMDDS